MRNVPHKSRHSPALVLLAATLLLAGPARAQTASTPAIDPKAQELLKQSAATYAAMQSYSCQVRTELTLDTVPESRIIEIKLAFQKPSQAAVSMTKYGQTRQFMTDGKSLYAYAPDKKEYVQEALRPNVPPTAPILTQGETFLGLVLLRPAGLADLADPARTASLTLGPVKTVDGAEVRTVTRVLLQRGGGKMTFYVTLGTKDHLLHHFADTIQSPKPLPMGEGKVKRIDNSETYTDLRVDPALPAATFLPPPDAKKTAPDTH